MPIDFFQTELHKVQDRFNMTFGAMVVCDLQTRSRVMLAIISLSLTERKIMAEKNREDIKKFVRTKDALNNFFDAIQRRDNHVERTDKRNIGQDSKTVRDRAYTYRG